MIILLLLIILTLSYLSIKTEFDSISWEWSKAIKRDKGWSWETKEKNGRTEKELKDMSKV